MTSPGTVSRKNTILLTLTAVPVVGVLLQVALFHVDIPFSDQWEQSVPLLLKAYNGTLGLADWLSQHNEHRPLFSRLIWLTLAPFTHWNTGVELLISLIFGLATLALLLALSSRLSRAFDLPAITTLWPAIAWLFFSMSQYENWLQSYLLQWVLHIFGVVAGFALLASVKTSTASFLGAVGMGLVATFTLAGGLLFWPLGFMILVWNCSVFATRFRRAIYPALWIVTFIAVSAIYLTGFTLPGSRSLSLFGVDDFPGIVLYFFSWLGAPLIIYVGSFVPGGLSLPLVAWLRTSIWPATRQQRLAVLPFLAVGAFSLANGFVISVARGSLSWQQALSPRYVIISSLFWVGVIAVLHLRLWTPGHQDRHRDTICRSVLGGISVLLCVSWFAGSFMGYKHRYLPMLAAQNALRSGARDDATLLLIHDDPSVVRKLVAVIADLHLSLFR